MTSTLSITPAATASACAAAAIEKTSEEIISEKIEYVAYRALTSIDLSGFELERIPKRLAKSAPWIEEISLGNNKFDSFPETLHKFPLLRWVDLKNNVIKSIANDFFSGSRVSLIDLSGNQLTEIDLVDCDFLSTLNLSNNPIEKISDKLLHKNSLTIILSPSEYTSGIIKDLAAREKIGLEAATIITDST